LNITPDSFSDGGCYVEKNKALSRARQMLAEGADIIDVGGESTRPGSRFISIDEELSRVIPIISALRAETDVCLSVDTSKPTIMRAAVDAGAGLINDVLALTQVGAVEVARELDVPVCLMHCHGLPETMQDTPLEEQNVMKVLHEFMHYHIERVVACGVARHHIIIDPGFGFGKTLQHNLSMINGLQQLKCFDLPILLGVSRKATIGTLLNKDVSERVIGSVVLGMQAIHHGAEILRVHDVAETKQALTILRALKDSRSYELRENV